VSRTFATLAVGLVLAAPQGASARTGLDALTLEQQVGQVLMLSFSGTAVPPYVRDAVRERRVAGVILFGGNIASPEQLRASSHAS
jgi:beta-N-acetylhexosaminidase